MSHTIQPGSNARILVTGANGFLAAWVVKTLLDRGHSVRGTVRSEAKTRHLKKQFKSYGDRLELVVVSDITKEHAFDEVVKDVDAIAHTASPFHMEADEPRELIDPAVNGTVGVLKSAMKNGSNVKRIVITASCASVNHEPERPRTFDERNVNDMAIQHVKQQGREASPMEKYEASKTLAEKAAWDFYEQHKKNIRWDLAVINPPYIFGPIIHEVANVAALNESAMQWYMAVLIHDSTSEKNLATQGHCWVDVRDVAEAHARALEKEEAGGERMIVSAGNFVWQDWIDVANSLSPSPIPSHHLAKGKPGAGRDAEHKIKYDTSKSEKILGIRYKTKEETARDILADFEARGW